jgi:hypothetical protein
LIWRGFARALDWRFRAVTVRIDELLHGQRELAGRLDALGEALASLAGLIEGSARDGAATRALLDGEMRAMLRAVVDEEARNRRSLFALRDTSAYEAAFVGDEPLVSVTIATRDRAESLLGRALPSLLAQTHRNLEVVVVGDAAGPEVGEGIRRLGDSRVRYYDLTQRILADPDPRRHHLVGSTMARNEAQRRAQGSWLLHFDDDDYLRPDAVASLLGLAFEQRAEVVYGGFESHHPDGGTRKFVTFPPTPGEFAFPAALVHAGLGFLERELVGAQLALPGDIYLLTRMLRIGVRFAMLDRMLLDYFPSHQWGPGSSSEGNEDI